MSESEILQLIAGLRCSKKNPQPGDDIGFFPSASRTYAASDSVIAGVHYRTDWLRPADIAYKLFARNWSDFLCKGIKPGFALLNLALSEKSANRQFLRAFLGELDRLLTDYGIVLIGGDTARSAGDVFTLTFLGHHGKFIPRRAVRLQVGDLLLQIGRVGGSDYALAQLLAGKPVTNADLKCFSRPLILNHLPLARYFLASIDQSDSVQKSLALLAQANGVRITVETDKLIVSHARAARHFSEPGTILGAAEDLAIFAIASPNILRTRAGVHKTEEAFRVIGKVKSIREKRAHVEYFHHGKPLKPPRDGFEHFT